MGYLSTKDMAKKWSVSVRYVQKLLQEDRIPNAKRMGNVWMIPENAAKPLDLRFNMSSKGKWKAKDLLGELCILPKDPSMKEHFTREEKMDLEFRRGNDAFVIDKYLKASKKDKASLSMITLASAVVTNEYDLYNEIRRGVDENVEAILDEQDERIVSLMDIALDLSMVINANVPKWMRECDFWMATKNQRKYLMYLYILYLRNNHQYEAMLVAAKTELILIEEEKTFTWLDVYLNMIAAFGSHIVGEREETKQYLFKAIDLGIPWGYVAPYSDYYGSVGMIFDECLRERYPKEYERYLIKVKEYWKRSFKNWTRFHNRFTKDNMTDILTVQEYQVGLILANGMTYVEASRKMKLSVGRIKNIASVIYGKLNISGKNELKDYLL